jgi:8-oxo-dGTP pyrophosphatase MutT (NUDIX family)
MGKTEREFSSGGIVIRLHDSDIRILLIKDSYGRWTWPKGNIDKNEGSLEAAKREIKEETGLGNIRTIANIGQTNYFYKRERKLIYKTVYLYLFQFIGNESLSIQRTEITDGEWFSEREALSKIGYKDSKKFLKKAIKIFRQHNIIGNVLRSK